MSQDARYSADAALNLQTLRESISAIRRSIDRALGSGDVTGEHPDEAFRRAWFLALGSEQACRGVYGVMIAYHELAAPTWNTQVRRVMSELGQIHDGAPAELLARRSALLGDLELLLAALDSEVRDHAMLALGSGNVISEQDLRGLLDGPAA